MNCKQGDLAIVVRSCAGNDGKIVHCITYLGLRRWKYPDGDRLNATWLIDRDLPPIEGWEDNIIEDCQLQPLRDSDGEDEMLRLVGLPADSRQTV